MTAAELNNKSPQYSALFECLPNSLRNASTTISPVGAGNSGAGVFLVDCDGGKSILKTTPASEPVEVWRRAVATQRAAVADGLAPKVLHADEGRRAVLSEFVLDRSFPAFFFNPATRADALVALGGMVRRIHAISPLPDHPNADPVGMLANFWSGLQPDSSGRQVVPNYARDVWQRLSTERAPDADRAPVLSHNDMNPSNLVFDGERLLMFDWQTTSLNDPYYDLATIAMFLRMDERTTLQLLSAYDELPVTVVPTRFQYFRRMAAALSGSAFLFISSGGGYDEMDTSLTIEAAPTLSDVYTELRDGTLNLGLPAGQWRFGLALLKESAAT